MPGQHPDHPHSIHARTPLRPPQIHPCPVSTQNSLLPSMPGQHTDQYNYINARSGNRPPTSIHASLATDNPSSIHARSPLRPPQLHPCQVSTQITPVPSMPTHHSDHNTSIHAGQHTDHTMSIHARSAHRPPKLHPVRSAHRPPQLHHCHISKETTAPLYMLGQHTDHNTFKESGEVRQKEVGCQRWEHPEYGEG